MVYNKSYGVDVKVKGIINQWIQYIRVIHFSIFIKKKYKKYISDTDKLINKFIKEKEETEKKIQDLENAKLKKVAKLTNIKTKEIKNIYLSGKEMKINWFKKIWFKLFKFDGWLLTGDKANNFKFVKMKNLKLVYDMKKKESYAIHEKIGTFKNKPLFICKYPFPITLQVNDDGTLFYDAVAFHTYKNYTTRQNLLSAEEKLTLKSLIKTYFPVVIIAIVILILIFTPEGQDVIQQVIGGKVS